MSGSAPEQPANSDDSSAEDTPLLESEMRRGEEPDAAGRRRGIPVWLLPALGALAIGLLAGYFLFGLNSPDASAPSAVRPPDGVSAAAGPLVSSLARAEPVQLDIPAIEVASSLVDLGLNDDGTLEVPVDFSKTGWFTGGTWPGDPQGPPALIAGHVDDYTGPAVFYRLNELAAGDEVLITRADNTVAVFTVTSSERFAKSAFPSDQIYAPVADSELVLVTCTGDFDQGARSYLDNLVVRATLNLDRSLEESDVRAAAGTPAPAGDQPNA